MAKDNFNERKENRINYHKEKAVKKHEESESSYKTARELGSLIPMGQPILVGHHSERGHRAHIKKIDNAMRSSVNADKAAKYHEEKAKHIENDNAIYSDDPEAIKKLKHKIDSLVSFQESMKAVNKIVKSKKKTEEEKIEELGKMGISKSNAIVEFLKPDFMGRTGFPGYALSNNNANIKRCKDRLARLEQLEKMETKKVEINGVEVVENVEANRIQLIFPGKPEAEIRTLLKRNGFRWSPRFGAWQRHLNNAGRYAAETVLKNLEN
jgi:hypothetical protein